MRGHMGWGFNKDSTRFREILPWLFSGIRGKGIVRFLKTLFNFASDVLGSKIPF
jgi:hypothetical protein